MKKYCIDQPGCLGDILFTLKIAEELSKTGDVYWNIAPVFWSSGIDRIISSAILGPHYPRFIHDADNIKLCDLCKGDDPAVMTKKYEVVNIDWGDWSDYVKYDRISENEHSLRKHFNIEIGDPFILYNDTYGFDGKHHGVIDGIPKNYDGKIIKLEVFQDASIFDWCWIFENAEQIHTVDTSIQFVIETLDTKAELNVHPRHYKYTIPQVAKLFKKPWKWVEHDRDTWRKLCPREAEYRN
jgi:hypothetical protein